MVEQLQSQLSGHVHQHYKDGESVVTELNWPHVDIVIFRCLGLFFRKYYRWIKSYALGDVYRCEVIDIVYSHTYFVVKD